MVRFRTLNPLDLLYDGTYFEWKRLWIIRVYGQIANFKLKLYFILFMIGLCIIKTRDNIFPFQNDKK
jgi:hypothetical protein